MNIRKTGEITVERGKSEEVTDKDWLDDITEGSTVYEYTYDANGNITDDADEWGRC
jgi:YD repeat-containing protein